MSELDQIKMFVEMAIKIWSQSTTLPESYSNGCLYAFKATLDKINKTMEQSAVSDCANFDALCRIREILKDDAIDSYHALLFIDRVVSFRIEAETKAVKR